MREETEFRPKPMVPIGERPVLWHIMKYYQTFGHDHFILCLGYLGHTIKEYFTSYDLISSDCTINLGRRKEIVFHHGHDEASWTVTLANTGRDALKGARIKRIERYVKGDTFMLTYGDGLCDVDLDALLAYHRSHGKLCTVTGVNPTSQFGELRVDESGRVFSFREKPRSTKALVNGGYFVVNRGLFDYLSDDDACDLEVGALEELAQRGELMVFPHAGNWACMDTLRDRDRLNAMWERGEAFWKRW
jgi:glucose-1-phosphate cytidylyltransferase